MTLLLVAIEAQRRQQSLRVNSDSALGGRLDLMRTALVHWTPQPRQEAHPCWVTRDVQDCLCHVRKSSDPSSPRQQSRGEPKRANSQQRVIPHQEGLGKCTRCEIKDGPVDFLLRAVF